MNSVCYEHPSSMIFSGSQKTLVSVDRREAMGLISTRQIAVKPNSPSPIICWLSCLALLGLATLDAGAQARADEIIEVVGTRCDVFRVSDHNHEQADGHATSQSRPSAYLSPINDEGWFEVCVPGGESSGQGDADRSDQLASELGGTWLYSPELPAQLHYLGAGSSAALAGVVGTSAVAPSVSSALSQRSLFSRVVGWRRLPTPKRVGVIAAIGTAVAWVFRRWHQGSKRRAYLKGSFSASAAGSWPQESSASSSSSSYHAPGEGVPSDDKTYALLPEAALSASQELILTPWPVVAERAGVNESDREDITASQLGAVEASLHHPSVVLDKESEARQHHEQSAAQRSSLEQRWQAYHRPAELSGAPTYSRPLKSLAWSLSHVSAELSHAESLFDDPYGLDSREFQKGPDLYDHWLSGVLMPREFAGLPEHLQERSLVQGVTGEQAAHVLVRLGVRAQKVALIMKKNPRYSMSHSELNTLGASLKTAGQELLSLASMEPAVLEYILNPASGEQLRRALGRTLGRALVQIFSSAQVPVMAVGGSSDHRQFTLPLTLAELSDLMADWSGELSKLASSVEAIEKQQHGGESPDMP